MALLALLATTGIAMTALPGAEFPARCVAHAWRDPAGAEVRSWAPAEEDDPLSPCCAGDRLPAARDPSPVWEVVVKGADGKPVSGLDILARVHGMCVPQTCDLGRTDADGRAMLEVERAFFGGRRDQRSLTIYLGGGETGFGYPSGPEYELTQDGAVIIAEELIPVEVVVVDAQTGRPLEASVTVSPSHVCRHRDARLTFGPVEEIHEEITECALDVQCTLDLPPGYFLEGGLEEIRGAVSQFADRVRVVVPVRPEVSVRVLVLDPAGHPVSDADVLGWSGLARSDSAGSASLGIPYLQGEQITVGAVHGARVGKASLTLDGASRGYEVVVHIREPAADAAPSDAPFEGPSTNSAIGLGGACPETPEEVPVEEIVSAGTATMAVTVLRRIGIPATGVYVDLDGPIHTCAQVDRGGAARFDELAAGTYRVTVATPGFVTVVREATVGDSGHVRVDLVEPEGWTAEVQVVDEEGLAVPFASLEVSGDSEYASLDHGTQTLGLRTDVAGRARLPGLAGRVAVKARFGSRSARAEIDADHPTARLRLAR